MFTGVASGGKKGFFYLLEVAFCNALTIFRHHKSVPSSNAEKFRLAIIYGLLDGYERLGSSRAGRHVTNPPSRLTERHFLSVNSSKMPSGYLVRNDRAVCSDRKVKRHQTQFKCAKCNVYLCAFPCFERYHTLMNFKVKCSKELHEPNAPED